MNPLLGGLIGTALVSTVVIGVVAVIRAVFGGGR